MSNDIQVLVTVSNHTTHVTVILNNTFSIYKSAKQQSDINNSISLSNFGLLLMVLESKIIIYYLADRFTKIQPMQSTSTSSFIMKYKYS